MTVRAPLALALVALAAAPGCIEDRCTLGDSVRLLLVYPEHDPPSDTTNPHVFLSIQDALDAAPPPEGDTVETTICVADGVYREQLVVPPGVEIQGRGVDRVRLRPPGGRDDESLVRVETQALTASRIRGIDLGGTSGACIDMTGGGTLQVHESRLLDCGTALRASGGGDVGWARLWAVAIARSGLVLDLTAMAGVSLSLVDITGSLDLMRVVGTGDPDFVGDPGGGGGVGLTDVTLADNDGRIVASDSRIYFSGVQIRDDEGTVPDVPLVSLVASGAWFGRVSMQDAGARPLLAAEGGRVEIESSAWDGTDAPGRTTAAITLTGNATLLATHLTVLGDGPALNAEAGTAATITHSIAWGQEDAVRGEGDVDVRASLLQDATVPTTGANLPPADPQLTGWVPAPGSPARCAATAPETPRVALDLRGDPRPFTAGKTPDVGAVEVQASCP